MGGGGGGGGGLGGGGGGVRAGYRIEERRKWPVITASPRGQQ